MFFKNSKETASNFTNSLIELTSFYFKRYLGVLVFLWKKDRKQAILIYVFLFLIFILSLSVTQILSAPRPQVNTNTNSAIQVQSTFNTDKAPRSEIKTSDQINSKNGLRGDIEQKSSASILKIETLEYTQEIVDDQPLIETQNLASNNTIDPNIVSQANQTIEVLKNILGGFKNLLNSFVSNTPDVTGISTDRVNFSSGSFDTARVFSSKLFELLVPIYVIFLALEGINLVIKSGTNEQTNFNQILKKQLFAIFLLTVTPYILSYSIQGVNAFCQYMLGGKDLTSYLLDFLTKIQDGFTQNSGNTNTFNIPFIGDINAINNPIQTVLDGFRAFFVILPMLLIGLLYILIIGQFVIRFIKLYFLAAIYPIVVIFYASPIKNEYVGNYWNSWIRTLLHQAFFIFGYAIVQNFLLNMLNTGVGLEQIAIFIGSLLFLYNINTFSSEILGGAIHRGGNMLNSFVADVAGGAIGASIFASRLASQSSGSGSGAGSKGSVDLSQGVIGSKANQYRYTSAQESKNVSTNASSAKSNSPVSNTKNVPLADPTQSKQAQTFASQGYSVSSVDPNEGIISVQGKFYAHDEKGGVTTLYNSKQDAIEDRIEPMDLYPVEKAFNVQDTTNYAGRESFEQRSGTTLRVNATNQEMRDSLKTTKSENLDRGIDGITSTQVSTGKMATMKARGEKINKDTPRIQKTVVYTSSINKTKEANNN
jgi:hypothetical protein